VVECVPGAIEWILFKVKGAMEEYAERMKVNSFHKARPKEQREYAQKLALGPTKQYYGSLVKDAKVLDKPLNFK
jgi:hypothetical protein